MKYSAGYDFSAENNKQIIFGTQDSRRHENTCCNPWVSHYTTIKSWSTGYFSAEANNKQAASGQWVGLDPNINGYGPSNRYYITTGQWYTVEVRRRLNDAGQDNGIFEMWVNGAKITEYNNVRFRVPWDGTFGADYGYGTNFLMLSHYIVNPAPQDQNMYWDDVRISGSFIPFD